MVNTSKIERKNKLINSENKKFRGSLEWIFSSIWVLVTIVIFIFVLKNGIYKFDSILDLFKHLESGGSRKKEKVSWQTVFDPFIALLFFHVLRNFILMCKYGLDKNTNDIRRLYNVGCSLSKWVFFVIVWGFIPYIIDFLKNISYSTKSTRTDDVEMMKNLWLALFLFLSITTFLSFICHLFFFDKIFSESEKKPNIEMDAEEQNNLIEGEDSETESDTDENE